MAQMDDSRQANAEDSVGLQSSSDVSHTLNISASKLPDTSLSPTSGNRTGVILRSRRRQGNNQNNKLLNSKCNQAERLKINPVGNGKIDTSTSADELQDIICDSRMNVSETALETSVETDDSLFTVQKVSRFHSRAMNAKKRAISNMCNLSTDISVQLPPINSKNPFESALASDSSDGSISKSLELTVSGSPGRPDIRKGGVRSKLRSSKSKGFEKICDGFISSNISTDVENSLDANKKDIHGSHRQKKIKTASGSRENVFKTTFETSVETDISNFIPKISRFSKYRKNLNQVFPSTFEHVFDSTTDMSDASFVKNVVNNASVSQSGGSKNNLLSKSDEEKVNSEGNNIAITEYVARAPDKLAQNADLIARILSSSCSVQLERMPQYNSISKQCLDVSHLLQKSSTFNGSNEVESKSSQLNTALHIGIEDSMLFSSELDEIEHSIRSNANDRESSSINSTKVYCKSSRYDSITPNETDLSSPGRPDIRKGGFRSKFRCSQGKGFEKICDGFISSNISTDVENSLDADKKYIHRSHRQKKIKTASGSRENVFKATFETSVETDISNFYPKISRFSKYRKNLNQVFPSTFEHVFDSTTDMSDASFVKNVVNNASVSQSGGSKNYLLSKSDEEKVNSEGNNIAITEYVARAPDKLAQNADLIARILSSSCSVQLERMPQYNSISKQCLDVSHLLQKSSTFNDSNEVESKSPKPSTVLHIGIDDSMLFSSELDEIEHSVRSNANDRESSRLSKYRKNSNKVFPIPFEHEFDSTDTSDAQFVSNVVNNASVSQSGGSKNNLLSKSDEEKVNSEGNNIAITEYVARAPDKLAQNADLIARILSSSCSVQLERMPQYNSISKQCLDVSHLLQKSSTFNGSNEVESKSSQSSTALHIGIEDSMLFSSELDEIEHSIRSNANDRESSSINSTKVDCKSSRYDSITPNKTDLSTSIANRIVRVNENFDSMELTGNSIPIEITNVTFNESISVKMCVENRSLNLSPLKSQNVISIVDINNKNNENLNNTEKSIFVNKIIENTDISVNKVSPTLASLRKQAVKRPVNKINYENSLHYADKSSNRSLNKSSSEKSNSRNSQDKEVLQTSSLHTITNTASSISKASLRKRLSKGSLDKSKNKENSSSKLNAKGSLDKEKSQLSIIRSSPRIRASKDSQDKSNTGTSRNSIHLDGIMNSSSNRVSFRKRTLLASHAKSNLENFLLSSPPEIMDNSFSEISTASDDKSNKSKELQRNYSDKRVSVYEASRLDASMNISIMSNEIPLPELQNNYSKTENDLKKDCEAIERILTFPSSSKSTLRNIRHSNSDESKIVRNKNDDTLSTCKTPKLKKPKNWVTNDLYKFIIEKLEPKYHQKSRRRAERFVKFLVDKVIVVNHISVKDQYKKFVDALILEMAKLQLVETYFEFYYFVQTYLPHSFQMKSVPTLTPFNRDPLVDSLPPEKLFASII